MLGTKYQRGSKTESAIPTGMGAHKMGTNENKKKERSPAMQFYFRQFAADDAVTSMDLDAVGAHILLMCAAGSAESGYKIRADDRAIKTRLRNPNESDFQRIKAQLLAGAWKISDDGEWWIQDGMKRTLLKQKEFSRLQSERAKGNRKQAESKPDDSRIKAETQPSSSSTSTSTSSMEITNTPVLTNGHIPSKTKREFNPEGKTKYLDWVYLDDAQFERVKKYYADKGFGPDEFQEAIRALDKWFDDNPGMRKKRTDDAKALMGWPLERAIARRKQMLDLQRSEIYNKNAQQPRR